MVSTHSIHSSLVAKPKRVDDAAERRNKRSWLWHYSISFKANCLTVFTDNHGDEEAWLEMMQHIVPTFPIICTMAENVKSNKDCCKQIAQKARAMEDLVWIEFTQTNAFVCFMKSIRHKGKFMNVIMDKKLSGLFHILSGALLIELGKTLKKVYETVTGGERERMKSYEEARPAPWPLCQCLSSQLPGIFPTKLNF